MLDYMTISIMGLGNNETIIKMEQHHKDIMKIAKTLRGIDRNLDIKLEDLIEALEFLIEEKSYSQAV